MQTRINNRLLNLVVIGLLALILLGLFTWSLHTILGGNTIGADFSIYWYGNRAFWVEHQSPYGDEVTRQIQMAIYRRPARPNEDQVAYAYPLYALLLTAPTALLSLGWACAGWMAFNFLLLFTVLFLLFSKYLRWIAFTFPLFYQMAFGLILGNYVLSVILCLVTVIFLLVFQRIRNKNVQILCGILMAWATVKPQFSWMFLIFLVLLALKDRLWPFLISFFSSLVILIGGSFLALPGWFGEWRNLLGRYAVYNQNSPTITKLLSLFFAPPLQNILSVIIILLGLLFAGYLFYSWWKWNTPALSVLVWCGFMTFLVHPHGFSYDETAFLIPILFWAVIQKKYTPSLVGVWVGGIILSWVIFFAALLKILPNSINLLPLVLFAVWMIWYFWNTRNTLARVESREVS
jgi:hypothetical protein